MGYDLEANNPDLEEFRAGILSWPIMLESCGTLWPFMQSGSQWTFVPGVDSRMGDDYPQIISNNGFPITEEEAKIMARCVRNFVAIQRSLPEENKTEDARGKETLERKDVEEALMRGMFGGQKNWPSKIRTDLVDKMEKFCDWAEKSGGFKVR